MPLIDKYGCAMGRGGRKACTAYAYIKPGTGKIFINGMPYTEYFDSLVERAAMTESLYLSGLIGQFDIWATAKGGGRSGQAGALKQAVAVALQNFNPALRPMMKVNKLLTRDSRVVERKHTGMKKARKKATFVKR
jgi:small subunit ribosomal protein S9